MYLSKFICTFVYVFVYILVCVYGYGYVFLYMTIAHDTYSGTSKYKELLSELTKLDLFIEKPMLNFLGQMIPVTGAKCIRVSLLYFSDLVFCTNHNHRILGHS